MMVVKVIVEGESEEAFVMTVLAPHLRKVGVEVSPHKGTSNYLKTRRIIQNYLNMPSVHAVTTMFDLYELPDMYKQNVITETSDTPWQHVEKIEFAINQDIGSEKFFSYIQLHEYEALLLSDPGKLSVFYVDKQEEIAELTQICSQYETPELINSSPETAPSKRIIKLIPIYNDQKRTASPIIANAIGIEKMRETCPHFAVWLARLEALGTRNTE